MARIQTKDFDKPVEETTLAKDFELRDQMNASSGSVMDCTDVQTEDIFYKLSLMSYVRRI